MIQNVLNKHFQQDLPVSQLAPVFGGDINTCYECIWGNQPVFVKFNHTPYATAMLTTEYQGLLSMSATDTIRVPKPLLESQLDNGHLLILEHLDLSGSANWAQLARQLADMHAVTSDTFGWAYDNFIGTTVQYNARHADWAEFWWQQRLLPQITLAKKNGLSELEDIQESLKALNFVLFEHHTVAPSLVHGDLWSGNVGFSSSNTPVIYDPACYFGDREVDIALTKLFGGFSESFYRAYESAWPLAEDTDRRVEFYNLYHLLNHFNIFGGSYRDRCHALASKLIQQYCV